MTSLRCIETAALAPALVPALPEGARRRLDAHLGSCQGCAREWAMKEEVTRLSERAAQQLGPAARERAIQRALHEASRAPAPARTEAASRRLALPALAGALALAGLVAWVGGGQVRLAAMPGAVLAPARPAMIDQRALPGARPVASPAPQALARCLSCHTASPGPG